MLTLSPETEALVRAEAIKLGKSEDEVIRNALANPARAMINMPLPPPPSDLSEQERRKRIDAILQSYRALPVLDHRTADEILGYDENGLFK